MCVLYNGSLRPDVSSGYGALKSPQIVFIMPRLPSRILDSRTETS